MACQKIYDLGDLLESHKFSRNPDSIRHGNQMMKNAALVSALICLIGIYWKKKRLFIPARSQRQYNVMTLNQTVLLVILINLDSMLTYLLHPNSQQLFFLLELLKIIFIENIFFKCLIPVYLLLSSRRHYATLWVDRKPRRLTFFMTPPSFIARPVISKYKPEYCNSEAMEGEVKEISIPRNTARHAGHIIITVHAPQDQRDTFPPIEI